MSFRDALYTWIEANVAGTIYVGVAPQNSTLPYYRLQRIVHMPNTVFSGQSAILRDQWQFECWGATDAAAETLYETIQTAMSGKQLTMGSYTVQSVIFTDVSDTWQSRSDGGEDIYYRIIIDCDIFYQET